MSRWDLIYRSADVGAPWRHQALFKLDFPAYTLIPNHSQGINMLAEANQSAQTKVVLQFLQFDRKTHWQHYYLVQTVVANLLRINGNRVSTLYVCSIFWEEFQASYFHKITIPKPDMYFYIQFISLQISINILRTCTYQYLNMCVIQIFVSAPFSLLFIHKQKP